MRSVSALLVSALLILTLGGVAAADVDVKPLPTSPRVSLEGWKAKDSEHGPSSQQTDSRKPSRPHYENVVGCRVDEANGNYGCRTYLPADPDNPGLTEGDILRAVREIGLPSLEVQIQPGTSTLVNVETIFYTEPEQFNRSVTLLGFDIDLVATPVRYRWLHGDGTASTTTKPGKPYPSTEVTHRYRQPDNAVNPRVDVTYRVRYRVDGGAWTTIDQTLQASGPTAALEVKEAAPVLTHP